MTFAVLEFKTEYKGDKAIDKVLVAPIGEGFDRSQTWYAVHTLKPRDGEDGQMADMMRARWSVIGPKYEAWKKGEEIPEDGTPLGAWAGITADQAKYLKGMGIVTVEAVRDIGDSALDRLPFPGKRELPKMAAAFLESKGEADLAAKNAELLERIAAMEEMLLERDNDTPKRGRPRKSEAA